MYIKGQLWHLRGGNVFLQGHGVGSDIHQNGMLPRGTLLQCKDFVNFPGILLSPNLKVLPLYSHKLREL